MGKRYGAGRWILREVDLQVTEGDVLALVGGNGSGKSTLLRILVGLSRPSSGRITGRPREIGWVPDRFTAHDRISAASYLTHMGRIRGLRTAAARDRADALIDRLALAGGRDAAAHALQGQRPEGRPRAGAARPARSARPRRALVGAGRLRHGVLGALLGEVAAAGGAVVFTDHREALAETHATGTYAIAEGRVRRRGGRAAADGAAVTEIVLTGPAGPPGPDWSAVPGVLDAARRGGALVLRVEGPHSDAVLLTALRHRWSVDGVTRTDGGDGADRRQHAGPSEAAR